ncbi:hypothetical protein R6Q59_035762 [Mikania micrantha]
MINNSLKLGLVCLQLIGLLVRHHRNKFLQLDHDSLWKFTDEVVDFGLSRENMINGNVSNIQGISPMMTHPVMNVAWN